MAEDSLTMVGQASVPANLWVGYKEAGTEARPTGTEASPTIHQDRPWYTEKLP